MKELEAVGFRLVAAESEDLVELFDTIIRIADDEMVKEFSANQIDHFRNRVAEIMAKLEGDIRDLKSRAATEILELLPPTGRDKVLSGMGLKF